MGYLPDIDGSQALSLILARLCEEGRSFVSLRIGFAYLIPTPLGAPASSRIFRFVAYLSLRKLTTATQNTTPPCAGKTGRWLLRLFIMRKAT